MKRYLILAVFLLVPMIGMSQAKIFTKKNKLTDIAVRTTKVVLTGNDALDAALREEVSCRWRINAFEFCTAKDYEKLKTDNSFFFLKVDDSQDIHFLSYSRGGKKGDANALKEPIDIVSVPIGEKESSGTEFIYLPAFIDILQSFAEEASKRDKIAYGGLPGFCNPRKKRPIFYDRKSADSLFVAGAPNTLVELIIGQYRMIFSTDTHELHKFEKR